MNKFYIIAPVALLALFIGINFQFSKKLEKKKADDAIEAKALADKKAEEKKIAENKARKDAAEREAQRIEEDRLAEQKRKDKHEGEVKNLQSKIDEFKAASAKFAAELAAKEKTLSELRTAHERSSRAVFDLAKKVEAAKVQVRTAEMEIQRYTEMVSRKAAESSLAKAPVVATTP